MKKLLAVVIVSVILMISLLVLAFFYVDLSGHKGLRYELTVDGAFFGHVNIDKYVTEDKIVYKSSASYPVSSGYPAVDEKLFLKKRTMMPLKFIQEAYGVKGQKRLTLLVQNGDKTDFLFLEHPRFITVKGFETGEKTMVFSPDDIMLYMPIVGKYNFWKKGTQLFEVMVPVDEPIPPMSAVIEVQYHDDEYITVMGRKVEAETFNIKSKTLPEAKIFLSKHTHRILALEIKKTRMRFVLVKYSENFGKRIKPLLDMIISVFNQKKTANKFPAAKNEVHEKNGRVGAVSADADITTGRVETESGSERKKDVFFESGNLILSGSMWIPDGEGSFPAVLMIPEDGPMINEEQRMLDSFGEFLSAAGFVAFAFDSPGQGKSQGSFIGLDDEKKIQDIAAAVSYLKAHPLVKERSINLIGHKGGGYLAVKAAAGLPVVRSCILLGISPGPLRIDPREWFSNGNLQTILKAHGFGPFDEKIVKTAGKKAREQLRNVAQLTGDFSFFMGAKLPLREYREFIARKPYEAVLSFDRPLLLVFGRDDKNFNMQAVNELKKLLVEKNLHSRVAVFRKAGAYMGKMMKQDNSWTFVPNKDVLDLIRNWIIKNGVYQERPPITGSADAGTTMELQT